MRTIQATITLPADQLAELLAGQITDRHAAMVQKYGEACTKAQAARKLAAALGCTLDELVNGPKPA